MLNNKTVLVTGGTGSFGKSFVKIVLQMFPNLKKIIVFSRDEFKQFQMFSESNFKNHKKLKFIIGDIRDESRLLEAFTGVDVVVHAAALKQVDICERNPVEAIRTNVDGTRNVVNAAIKCNVKRVIALGTDKACEPVSTYGATKLCADKLIVSGNFHPAVKDTKFSVVRCGNLIGSRGSVIPYFKDLILRGVGELPITDFRMTRFWVSVEEVAEMIFTALDVMQGGELFVRKASSMKVVDLAMLMAPHLKLKEVGIGPGEKLYEVMISNEEASNVYDFGEYYVISKNLNDLDFCYETYFAGKKVQGYFEYRSDTNNDWFSTEKMKMALIKDGFWDFKSKLGDIVVPLKMINNNGINL